MNCGYTSIISHTVTQFLSFNHAHETSASGVLVHALFARENNPAAILSKRWEYSQHGICFTQTTTSGTVLEYLGMIIYDTMQVINVYIDLLPKQARHINEPCNKSYVNTKK